VGGQDKDRSLKLWIKFMRMGRRTGCHQMSDRSFYYKGWQFPVCARCTGVLFGNIAAIAGAFIFVPGLGVFLVGCAVMFLDWLLQRIGLLESTNARRLITGILGGYSLLSIMYVMVIRWILGI